MAKNRINKSDLHEADPFSDLKKSSEEARASVVLLEKSLEAVKQASKMVKSSAPKTVGSAKDVKDLNEAQRKSNELYKAKLNIDKDLKKERLRLQELNKQQNKLLREEITLEQKQLGTLERLKVENTQLRREREKLNLETKEGVQRMKEINAQLDKNNAKIKSSGDAMKQQRMNVGNYQSAVSSLRGSLLKLAGAFGLAFGGGAIIKNAFNTIKDFQQGTADLASVLGVSTDQMGALTEQAKQLGATTTFTATQVSELQKEFAKLGFTQSEIENVTEATLLLAEATGTELGRAAEVAGATIRGFGLSTTETQKVVDVMAKSFSSSSLDMEKFSVAMAAAAPVAKTFGFTLEETTAMIGTLTDRGIDASTAGTSLRNMMLDANKAGLTLEQALEKINNSSDKAATSFDLFGKRGATTGVILAENATSIDELNGKLLEADGAAKKMAETQRNTLGGAIALLQSAWDGLVLSMDEAGGVGEKLRKGIVFLADNLQTIVTVIVKLVQGFLAFKAAMLGLKLADQIKNFRKFGNSVGTAGENMTKAQASAKNFGRSLKAIGWTTAIYFAIELANGFLKIANGAIRAERELAKINSMRQKGQEGATKNIEELNEATEKRLSDLQKQRDLEEITAEEFLLQQQKIRDDHEKTLKSYIKTVEARKLARQKEFFQAKQDLSNLGLSYEEINNMDFNANLASAELARKLGLQSILPETKKKLLEALDALEKAKAGVEGAEARIDSYNEALKESNKAVDDAVHQYEMYDKSLSDVKDSAKESSDEIGKLGERIQETNDIIRESSDFSRPEFVENMSEYTEMLNNRELELLKSGATQEEIQREMLKKEVEILQMRIEAYEFLGEDTVELEIELQKKLRQLKENGGDDQFKIEQKYIDLATDYFVKRADERIAKIEEEMKMQQDKYDLYAKLASEGNITAQQSLAEQERLIAESNLRKEQEEKRKQRILLVSSVLSAYNANLQSGDNSTEAFTKAITSSGVLQQFIAALPAFESGTEDTGLNGGGIDGRGGMLSVLHPNERVMTKDQNLKMKGVSNDEVADIIHKWKFGKLVDGSQVGGAWETMSVVNELMSVKGEISEVKNAIMNKPEHTAEIINATARGFTLLHQTKTPRKTITKRYKS